MRRLMRISMSIVMVLAVAVPVCAWAVDDEFGIETDVYIESRDARPSSSSSSSSEVAEDKGSNPSPEVSKDTHKSSSGDDGADEGSGSIGFTSGSTLAKTGWWLLDHWWVLFIVGSGLVVVGVVREKRARR